MGMNVTRLFLVSAGLALCAAAAAAWQLTRIHAWNTAITAGGVAANAASDQPRVRFAAAYAEGAHGKIRDALDAYRELDAAADAVIRRNGKFNSGNLYLQVALEARTGANADTAAALTLLELAKQSYRDVLREDSGDWDARYNLELALRLDPDPDQEVPELPVPPTRNKTPTVGLGSSLGLP